MRTIYIVDYRPILLHTPEYVLDKSRNIICIGNFPNQENYTPYTRTVAPINKMYLYLTGIYLQVVAYISLITRITA